MHDADGVRLFVNCSEMPSANSDNGHADTGPAQHAGGQPRRGSGTRLRNYLLGQQRGFIHRKAILPLCLTSLSGGSYAGGMACSRRNWFARMAGGLAASQLALHAQVTSKSERTKL